MRQLTAQLAELNSRLGDELAAQQRLVADYDRIRETAQRALGVLHIVRDAEAVLAETKDSLLAVLAERDDQQDSEHHQQVRSQQVRPPSSPPDTDNLDDDDDDDSQISAAAIHDWLGVD